MTDDVIFQWYRPVFVAVLTLVDNVLLLLVLDDVCRCCVVMVTVLVLAAALLVLVLAVVVVVVVVVDVVVFAFDEPEVDDVSSGSDDVTHCGDDVTLLCNATTSQLAVAMTLSWRRLRILSDAGSG